MFIYISGFLSSGANADTDGSEELTTASDTDSTMSDSVEVADMSQGSDKTAISGKTETIDFCYSSSDDSSLSTPKAQTSKHQEPYFKLVQHNPAPEMTTKYPFQQPIKIQHPIPIKSNIMDNSLQHTSNQLTYPSPRRCSVSRGTSPIPTVDLKNNNMTPFPAPKYTPYYIKRAKLVRQKPLVEESCSSMSEIPASSTTSPSPSPISPSSSSSSKLSMDVDITDTISLDSMDLKPQRMRCIVTHL
jgi:hypothetical protein